MLKYSFFSILKTESVLLSLAREEEINAEKILQMMMIQFQMKEIWRKLIAEMCPKSLSCYLKSFLKKNSLLKLFIVKSLRKKRICEKNDEFIEIAM